MINRSSEFVLGESMKGCLKTLHISKQTGNRTTGKVLQVKKIYKYFDNSPKFHELSAQF